MYLMALMDYSLWIVLKSFKVLGSKPLMTPQVAAQSVLQNNMSAPTLRMEVGSTKADLLRKKHGAEGDHHQSITAVKGDIDLGSTFTELIS